MMMVELSMLHLAATREGAVRSPQKSTTPDPGGIGRSPDLPGVYMLFHGRRTVFIGMAEESIRHALEAHKQGDEGALSSHATDCWFERTGAREAGPRQRQLLDEYKQAHNLNIPAGNRFEP